MVSSIAAGMILVVLFIFSLLEGWIDKINQIRTYRITCPFENETLHRYEELFASHHLKYKRIRQCKSLENMISGEWIVQGSEKNHRHAVHQLLQDPSVKSMEY
jgi:putative Mg2+ transporter-C (MgtC) family protein